MLAAWVLIGLISMQQSAPEPRFTRTAEVGGQYAAALFELDDDGSQMDYRVLLDLPAQAELDIQTVDDIVLIAARDIELRSRALLAASPDNSVGQGKVCRLTRVDDGGHDNLQNAFSWCLTFFGQTPTIHIRPVERR